MPRLMLALLAAMPLAACSGGGKHDVAKALIAAHCAACHIVPGIGTARGTVGPSLEGVGGRTTIAGVLPNTPENMRGFLLHPRAVVPNGAMPELGLTPEQAGKIADYLATLDKP